MHFLQHVTETGEQRREEAVMNKEAANACLIREETDTDDCHKGK